MAMAVARGSSGEGTRRSTARRSTRLPHMPQNFCADSLACPQAWHFKPSRRTLLSALRRSSRTPHIPQNLFSGRFSVPQKVHNIGSLLPFNEEAGQLDTLLAPAAQLFRCLQAGIGCNRIRLRFLHCQERECLPALDHYSDYIPGTRTIGVSLPVDSYSGASSPRWSRRGHVTSRGKPR